MARKITTGIDKGILKWVSVLATEVPQRGSLICGNAVAFIQARFAMLQAWHSSWKFDEWASVQENGQVVVCTTGVLLEQKC